MVALTQQERQLVELFRKPEPSRRRVVLLELAQADPDAWKRFRPEASLACASWPAAGASTGTG